jgi:hypothetical protein
MPIYRDCSTSMQDVSDQLEPSSVDITAALDALAVVGAELAVLLGLAFAAIWAWHAYRR